MDNGFSILMILFSVAILLYAGLLALTKDYNLLPRNSMISVEPKDQKAYAVRMAKVIALVALAPLAGGLVGFLHLFAGLAVMLIGFIASIYAGTKIMKNVM